MEQWDNVTYKFEWFADGKSIKTTERCDSDALVKCRKAEKYVDSILHGLTDYAAGVWVRNIYI